MLLKSFSHCSFEYIYRTINRSIVQVRDATWATSTVPVGFTVQGIWPQIDDGFDVQTVHRSKSGRLLAKGDDDGRVAVSYFPCTHEKEAVNAVGGHATHITKVGNGIGICDSCVWYLESVSCRLSSLILFVLLFIFYLLRCASRRMTCT